MKKTEHLLACLAEEAGEVVQACGKALRFGLEAGHPASIATNEDDIVNEINDMMAVANLLLNTSGSDILDDEKMTDKTIKVDRYIRHAQSTRHVDY